MAFCAHAITEPALMEVPDALDDARFNTNPLVLDEPKIRFYAGVPLRTRDGYNLGTLCAIDRKPRVLDPHQRVMLQLMAELVMRELELRQRSMQCPVTGLYNRSVFFRFGEQEFEQARDECRPLAIFNFDIDDFRQINIRWGHQSGDQVLLDVCAVVQQQLGHEDLFGRIGDEEFSVLLVNASVARVNQLAEGIRQAIAAMRGVFDHSDYQPRISGGITALADSDQSFADLFYRADQALYLAKGNGRNQVASLLVD
jgi:diguanylate cyclase (GGDEF)-like protein